VVADRIRRARIAPGDEHGGQLGRRPTRPIDCLRWRKDAGGALAQNRGVTADKLGATAAPHEETVGPECTVDETVARCPATAAVFIRHRMHCVGCDVARFETLAAACRIYGQPLEAVLAELQEVSRVADRNLC
jgi:hybrid cluster-associated redox disulfide protein